MAPPSPFNVRLSDRRVLRLMNLPLDEVLAVKDGAGVKVNDVALCVVGGALRRYLQRIGHPVEPSLVSYLPITLQADSGDGEGDGGAGGGNNTTVVAAELGTDEPDPERRLTDVAERTRQAKERAGQLNLPVILDVSALTGPMLGSFLERLAVAGRVTELFRLAGNTTVSNVATIPFPLWSQGAKIERVYPIGPISDGTGLNFTLLNYEGRVAFTMLADPEALTDPDALVADFDESWQELRDAMLGEA